MKVKYINIESTKLSDPRSESWNKVAVKNFNLMPSPLGLVKDLSPFLALSDDHGKTKNIQVQAVHNGKDMSIRLHWVDETKNDEIIDLDEFSDGVAIMFPLTAEANAITMGDEKNPVNAWFWKADVVDAFDIVAHGYSTSQRRQGKQYGLNVKSHFENSGWTVVFQRSLRSNLLTEKQISFAPNKKTGLAFAVWDGANKERSGKKAIFPSWEPLEIEA